MVPEMNLILNRERTMAGQSSSESSISDLESVDSTSIDGPVANALIIFFALVASLLISGAGRLAEGVVDGLLKSVSEETEFGRMLTTSRLPDGVIPNDRTESSPTMIVVPTGAESLPIVRISLTPPRFTITW